MTHLEEFEFFTDVCECVRMWHLRCNADSPDFDYLAQAVAWAEGHLKECGK